MADTTKQTLYTPEGYRELENELNYLKYTKREEVKEQIAVARSYGDLSETRNTTRRAMSRQRPKHASRSWKN